MNWIDELIKFNPGYKELSLEDQKKAADILKDEKEVKNDSK